MFNEAVITMDGLALDAKIRAGHTVATFTHIKLGDGIYDGTEDLNIVTTMKSIRQSFGISSILVTDNKTVRLRTVSNNENIDEGYLISEIGIFAQDPEKGEILYSIALGVAGKMDYQPSESELPGATSTFDTYVSVSNVEAATILTDCGAAASADDLEEIKNPEFDDSGEVTGITNFPAFLEKIKSKMNIFEFFKNLKAGLQFVLHTGQIVNNCVSDNPGLPLSAAQGKILMDLINQTNGNISNRFATGETVFNTVNDFPMNGSGFGSVREPLTLYEGFTIPKYSKCIFINYTNSNDGALIAIKGDKTYTAFRNNSIWQDGKILITNTDLQTEQYMIPQPTPGNIFKAFDIWGCRLYKSGKIVTLRLNCGCEMVASSDEHILFNLPEKYKPADDNIIINYITQKGLNMMISIKNNGEFRLFNNNQTVPKNDWLLRQCITYVTN